MSKDRKRPEIGKAYESDIKRSDIDFLEDVMADDLTNINTTYIESKEQTYNVTLVAGMFKKPVQVRFEVTAPNMWIAQTKAMVYWQNAVTHMDTEAHFRMGIHFAEEGTLADNVHFGENFPNVKQNEPVMIVISDPSCVGVAMNDQTEVMGEVVADSLGNDFAKYLEEIQNGKEEE